jgi:hypothetical protein
MNWLVTKGFKHDKQQDRFVEDPKSSLVGLSEMSNNGFVISGKVTETTLQHVIENKSYPYIFKVFTSNDDLVVEGICEEISAAPLLSINRELYNFDIEYIQFIQDGQVVDVLLVEDELDMSMEEED